MQRFRITETGWGMPLQLWVQAARLGLRIKEIGVPRVYLDPTRTFRAGLDDAKQRTATLPQTHEVQGRLQNALDESEELTSPGYSAGLSD